ncbi:MAG: amphi-Trp domain-containing protein [Halolamina sp.]
MPEELLFESESRRSRAEIAEYLRSVADSLEAGGEVTFRAGGDTTTVEPPENTTFEVNVEREGPPEGTTELSVEFEIEWDETAGNGDLEVE